MKRRTVGTTIVLLIMSAFLIFSTGCSTAASTRAPGYNNSGNNNSGNSNNNNNSNKGAATAAATQGAPGAEEPITITESDGKGASYSDKDGLRYCDDYVPDTSGEEYQNIDELPFRSPIRRPLSTFSADPDSASYSNIRRLLTDGSAVPKDAVRIEELINYFHYDYPQPEGNDPFSVTTEYADCPWNKDHKLMLVGVQGKDVMRQDLPPSNLVFLLDISGSMGEENKLSLVKKAFRMLVDRLGEKDTVSIVTYASDVDVVLEGVSGSKKSRLLNAIEDLEAGGSTSGAKGLQMAYDVAQDYFINSGNNRVILASDGDFNVGPSSDAAMVRLIEDKRKTGVFLSVLGFGMGNLKDSKMEGMAKNGNGNYAYIDGIQEARKVMVREMGGTLLTIAKDVKIQVEFNPQEIKGYRLIGYENNILADDDFNNDRVDAGEIGAGHRVTALYEIVPTDSDETVSGSDLKYQASKYAASGELCTVSMRYKEPDWNRSRLLSFPVGGSSYSRNPSDNFLFASSVAEFGLLLRNSRYKGNASYNAVYDRAEKSANDDLKGEFLDLVKMANDQN